VRSGGMRKSGNWFFDADLYSTVSLSSLGIPLHAASNAAAQMTSASLIRGDSFIRPSSCVDARLLHGAAHALVMLGGKRREGQPDAVLHQVHRGNGPFDGNRVRFGKQVPVQAH